MKTFETPDNAEKNTAKMKTKKGKMAEEMHRNEVEKNDAEHSLALTMYATKNVMNYTSNTPNLPTGISLEGYHFDTVSWGGKS